MKTLPRIIPILCLLLSLPVLAQRPPSGNTRRTPRSSGGAPSAPPAGQAPEGLPSTQSAPSQVGADGAGIDDDADPSGTPPVSTRAQPSRGTTRDGETTLRPKPTCEQVRRNAKFNIFLKGVAIEDLVQTVSDATCKTFILPESVRGKITIVGPENGKSEVNADQFYRAFLAALDANGLSVYQSGQYLKIVDKRSAKQSPIPFVGPGETPINAEQMVTAIFKVKNVEMEPLRGVLQQLVSKDGDTIAYPPDTIIVNDLGSNLRRLQRVVEQLDERATSADMRVIQVQYASAQDIAATVQKIFESPSKASTPTPTPRTRRPGNAQNATTPAATTNTGSGGGAATLSQIIADERTNKLIIVASPAGFERIEALISEVDVPISGEGRINVYYLNNASAEDLAGTLSGLTQGAGSSTGPNSAAGQSARARAAAMGGARTTPAAGTSTAELFSGEVKISADAATNSLVIVASQSDYQNVRRVIEKLDIARRQVFIEAVIMEVNLNRNGEFGIQLHSGVPVSTPAGAGAGLVGTKYGSGLPPSFSLTNLVNFSGLVAGLSGPAISSPALTSLGLTIPQFGLVLHALQTSSDVNVLSTPHILTSDNEEAEITVGQNVPFQAGYAPSSVGAGLGGAGGALGALGGLGGLGGLNSLYAPISRQNVELKLTVKPQINDNDYVRLAITQQTEEIASNDPVLGPTTSKRSVKTVISAKDQETVVLGGIMQDRTIESVSKVPVLGDLPILGYLFRESTQQKVKTNLLLVLTPYIIRDQSDFRRIFEKKLQERQRFVEQFYGQIPDYEVAMDFSRKTGPLGRMTQTLERERNKIENGGQGEPGARVISPGQVPPTRPAGGEGAAVDVEVEAESSPDGDGAQVQPRLLQFDAGSDRAPAVESDGGGETSGETVPAPALETRPPVEQERIQPGGGEDVDG